MEKYTTGTGQVIRVHTKEECRAPEACVIHNPSNHSMRDFPTHWRGDRYLMERICSHGVGHPDPDDIAFKRASAKTTADHMNLKYEGVHGCDGCCLLKSKPMEAMG